MYVFGNNGSQYVSNNTAAANIASAEVANATLAFDGSSTAAATNNIFWNNTSGAQTDVFGPTVLLTANDIQKIAQTPAAGSSGNISVDPQFASASDFHLTTGSPAINAGVNVPPGGLASLDLDGLARVQRARWISGRRVWFIISRRLRITLAHSWPAGPLALMRHPRCSSFINQPTGSKSF